jgi:sarcosine oxidase subunit alpha
VDEEAGAEVLTARDLVLATGAHDGVLAFENNDLPGVMSARAGGLMLACGVLPGAQVVVVVPPGGGPFGSSFVSAARSALGAAGADAARDAERAVVLVEGVPVRAKGTSRVKAVVVRDGSGERSLEADALLVDAPRAPAYELCEQAGAALEHRAEGFVVKTAGGRVRDGVWAVGEVTGTPFDAAALLDQAHALAAALG